MDETLGKEQVDKILNILKLHNVNLENFKCIIVRKGSPKFYVTGCCMSYGSQKAFTYAMEEGFDIINIYYKNKIVANSLIWINELYNCPVLDNIEVLANYYKLISQLQIYFRTTTQYLLETYNLYFVV